MENQFEPGTFVIVANKNSLCDLSTRAQVTWLALCAHANEDGNCWPSINRLAAIVGVGHRTIQRGLEELIEKKWVKKENRYRGDGAATSNYYTLFLVKSKQKKTLKNGGYPEVMTQGVV